jgi:nucleotide-binding universal stress UspA family protein
MPEDKKRPITREQMLLKVGFRHEWDNKITDQGIRPTIMGRSFQYAVPPALYLQNVGKRASVIYDPYDMSQVLVTDDQNIRFLANSITPMPGCMADMKDGGRAFLNQVLDEAKADTNRVAAAKERRQAVLIENDFDVETVIKLGTGVAKEIRQLAEQRYLTETIDRNNFDPMTMA